MDAMHMMRAKAVKEFYDGLSVRDKMLFMHHFVQPNEMFQYNELPKSAKRSDGFIVGVGENVVGNAVYDIALGIGRNIIKSIRL